MASNSNSDIADLFAASVISAKFASNEAKLRARKKQGASLGGKITGAANTAWRGHFLGNTKTAISSGYTPRKKP